MSAAPRIRRAGADDVEAVARLFDLYRQFYRQPADAVSARRFIADRIARDESVILVAESGGELLGFTQLYPTFCSVAAARMFVLYDLFVAPAGRRRGVGRALMQAAAEHARAAGAARLELATAKTNHPAQALYRSLGWVRDEEFDHYSLDPG